MLTYNTSVPRKPGVTSSVHAVGTDDDAAASYEPEDGVDVSPGTRTGGAEAHDQAGDEAMDVEDTSETVGTEDAGADAAAAALPAQTPATLASRLVRKRLSAYVWGGTAQPRW